MAIIVYNKNVETHVGDNNYPIYRGTILGNPYTDIKDRKTKALYVVANRDEAIARYSDYFDRKYKGDVAFKAIVDEIYEKYKNGEDVYLECYCGVGTEDKKNCHGEVIAEKLQKRLVKEKFKAWKETSGTNTTTSRK